MVGIEVNPKRFISAVFLPTIARCGSISPEGVIPPVCAAIEASCASIAATGSLAASNAAPCISLVWLRMPTGIQMNLAWDFNGLAACHKTAQWGHWGSKNT